MYGIIMSTEGGDSMRKIKEALFSEKGMKAVNALFLLAALLRNSGIIFAAYITVSYTHLDVYKRQ